MEEISVRKVAHVILLAREMDRQDRRPDLFIQVNTGEEPQKAGVLPAEADPKTEKEQ